MQICVKVLNIFNGAVLEVIILLMMVLSNSVSNKEYPTFTIKFGVIPTCWICPISSHVSI